MQDNEPNLPTFRPDQTIGQIANAVTAIGLANQIGMALVMAMPLSVLADSPLFTATLERVKNTLLAETCSGHIPPLLFAVEQAQQVLKQIREQQQKLNDDALRSALASWTPSDDARAQ